ncbi:hypothetical protein J4466_04085 [Candidatus Pacearchaeota archaeon]|nr:hypothetical protein [Candidatus Pacearchaeota archaeon]
MYEFSRALINTRLERLLNSINLKQPDEKCLNCGSEAANIIDFVSGRRYCSIDCMKEHQEYVEIYLTQD